MNFVRGERESEASVLPVEFNWDYDHGRVDSIPIQCYETEGGQIDPNVPPILFLGGYGERNWATKRVMREFGRLGLRAVGLVMPFDLLTADKLAVETACVEVPRLVADHYREQQALAHGLPVIAESQGAGVLLRSVEDQPDSFADIGLDAPVCVHLEKGCALSEEQRRRQFYHRFFANALKQPLSDPVNLASVYTIGSQLLFDISTGRFPKKVGLAMTRHFNETVQHHLARGHKVVIVSGTDDRVFPATEIEAAFKSFQPPGTPLPDYVTVPGTSHVASASKKGIAVLGTTLKHLGLINPKAAPAGTQEIPPPNNTADTGK